jgi:hypothetical protein
VPLAGTTIGKRLLGEVTGFGSMAKQEIGPAKRRQVDDPRVPCSRLLQQLTRLSERRLTPSSPWRGPLP